MRATLDQLSTTYSNSIFTVITVNNSNSIFAINNSNSIFTIRNAVILYFLYLL